MSIYTPCSVKAYGRFDLPPLTPLVWIEVKFLHRDSSSISEPVKRNIKSSPSNLAIYNGDLCRACIVHCDPSLLISEYGILLADFPYTFVRKDLSSFLQFAYQPGITRRATITPSTQTYIIIQSVTECHTLRTIKTIYYERHFCAISQTIGKTALGEIFSLSHSSSSV